MNSYRDVVTMEPAQTSESTMAALAKLAAGPTVPLPLREPEHVS